MVVHVHVHVCSILYVGTNVEGGPRQISARAVKWYVCGDAFLKVSGLS